MTYPPVPSARKRPIGLTILAVLFIIVSVFAFFGAAGAAAQGAILEAVGMSPTAVIITGVLSGILGLAAGVAMLMGRAYMLVIGAVVIYIIISLINPFLQPAAITDPITGQQIDLRGQSLAGSAISILIALVVLFYLTRGHVKAFSSLLRRLCILRRQRQLRLLRQPQHQRAQHAAHRFSSYPNTSDTGAPHAGSIGEFSSYHFLFCGENLLTINGGKPQLCYGAQVLLRD